MKMKKMLQKASAVTLVVAMTGAISVSAVAYDTKKVAGGDTAEKTLTEQSEMLARKQQLEELKAEIAGGEVVSSAKETLSIEEAQKLVEEQEAERLQMLSDLWLVDGQYRKTADGLTYGPIELDDVVGEAPDLVAVIGMNGEHGYAKLHEYDPGYGMTTMEEVRAYLEVIDELIKHPIPVYDLDGNVIDQFKIGSGDGT